MKYITKIVDTLQARRIGTLRSLTLSEISLEPFQPEGKVADFFLQLRTLNIIRCPHATNFVTSASHMSVLAGTPFNLQDFTWQDSAVDAVDTCNSFLLRCTGLRALRLVFENSPTLPAMNAIITFADSLQVLIVQGGYDQMNEPYNIMYGTQDFQLLTRRCTKLAQLGITIPEAPLECDAIDAEAIYLYLVGTPRSISN